jgi:hypothetical protein
MHKDTTMNKHPLIRFLSPEKAAAAFPAFLLAALFFAAMPLPADTAEGPPEGVLWTQTALSAEIALDRWDSGGRLANGNIQFVALGFGLEYGVLPWASLSAQWQPGVLLTSYTSSGPAGNASDFQFGLRLGLLGERAFIKLDFLRLALIAGVKSPLPSGEDAVWEPDLHLWGVKLGASLDYIPVDWFQLNCSGTVFLNPEQASNNAAFSRQTVNHPMDMTFELEPRFGLLSPNGVIFSLPIVYEFSPESEIRGNALGDERHFLHLGLGYTIAIRDTTLPFEVNTRLFVPLAGTNQLRLQRVEISGKIAIPIVKTGQVAQ